MFLQRVVGRFIVVVHTISNIVVFSSFLCCTLNLLATNSRATAHPKTVISPTIKTKSFFIFVDIFLMNENKTKTFAIYEALYSQLFFVILSQEKVVVAKPIFSPILFFLSCTILLRSTSID